MGKHDIVFPVSKATVVLGVRWAGMGTPPQAKQDDADYSQLQVERL